MSTTPPSGETFYPSTLTGKIMRILGHVVLFLGLDAVFDLSFWRTLMLGLTIVVYTQFMVLGSEADSRVFLKRFMYEYTRRMAQELRGWNVR